MFETLCHCEAEVKYMNESPEAPQHYEGQQLRNIVFEAAHFTNRSQYLVQEWGILMVGAGSRA